MPAPAYWYVTQAGPGELRGFLGMRSAVGAREGLLTSRLHPRWCAWVGKKPRSSCSEEMSSNASALSPSVIEGACIPQAFATLSYGLAVAAGVGVASGLLLVVSSSPLLSQGGGDTWFLVAILLAWGSAIGFGVSAIMACSVAGIVVANVRPETARASQAYLAPFGSALFTAFYTLAGMGLDFQELPRIFGLVVLYFVARLVGKCLSTFIAALSTRVSTAPGRGLGSLSQRRLAPDGDRTRCGATMHQTY